MKLNQESKPQIKQFLNDKLKDKNVQILVFVVLLLVIMVGVLKMNLRPTQSEAEKYVLQIHEGAYFDEVLNELEDEAIIKSKFFTKVYAKLTGNETIQAGFYDLDKSWSSDKIIKYINTTTPHSDITIKFHEGSWAKDIAKVIAENFDFEEDEILDTWNDVDFVKALSKEYPFITKEVFENQKDKKVLLEGFLYPDTYALNIHGSIEDITHVILDNFELKIASIQKEIDEGEHSLYDLLTLSSIVMYEAGDAENQRMVAGVFENRFKEGMRLQSSVTVCYALYEYDSWEDCEINTNIDSPYNTYIEYGLPISPILNPNIDAIKNTLNYVKHDYLFFVADVYEGGDGTVYYSKTFEQHDKKVKELRGR